MDTLKRKSCPFTLEILAKARALMAEHAEVPMAE
jgi:hypothetical protein